MAWTASAAQRRSLALSGALTSGQRHLSNQLFYIGKGDLTRGACVAFAAFLTVAGALAPHLGPETLAGALFLSGAGLALFAAFSVQGFSHTSHLKDVKSLNSAPERPVSSLQSAGKTQHIVELLMQTSQPAIDLASWSRLTTRMSHELRTPLNAVLGFSELMSHEVFGPLGSDRYACYARDIHASGRMLLKSTEDALAITALLTGSQRRDIVSITPVAAAIDEAIAFHTSSLNAQNVSLTLDIPQNLEVLAEPQTLRQIMINLLAEAVAQARDAATLKITARDHGGEIEISLDLSHCRPQCEGADSFSLLLARTLLELTGSRLCEAATSATGWHLSARLTRAAQEDFFAKS